MRNLLKNHPFGVFYFWCWLIPSVIVLSLLYFPAPFYWIHGGPFDVATLAQVTARASGVHMRDGALIPMLRAYGSQGILVFFVLCSAIPAVVALALAPITFGKRGLRNLLFRLRPWTRSVGATQGLKVWGLAVLSLIATNLLAFLLLQWMGSKPGESLRWNYNLLSFAFFWLLLEAMFTNQGGLLEELGWRGYALPLLLERINPLQATILLGLCWGLWHITRDVLFHTIHRLGLATYLLEYLPLFLAWCVGGSILMTYFFNRTGGCALICIAIHGLLNDSAGISGRLISPDMIRSVLPRAMAVLIAGIVTALLSGSRLGMRPGDVRTEPPPGPAP